MVRSAISKHRARICDEATTLGERSGGDMGTQEASIMQEVINIFVLVEIQTISNIGEFNIEKFKPILFIYFNSSI